MAEADHGTGTAKQVLFILLDKHVTALDRLDDCANGCVTLKVVRFGCGRTQAANSSSWARTRRPSSIMRKANP